MLDVLNWIDQHLGTFCLIILGISMLMPSIKWSSHCKCCPHRSKDE